jgi:hypothetical protein
MRSPTAKNRSLLASSMPIAVRASAVEYACQQALYQGPRRLQAARLKVFLGNLPDDTKTLAKPPLMHRRTYGSPRHRLRTLEANSNSQATAHRQETQP